MITVGMNYRVRSGKQARFETVCQAVIAQMQGLPGHRRSFLFRDVSDDQHYLILSDWNDREAFEAFLVSEQFRRVADWGKEEILAGRPTHDYYEK